MKNLIIVTFIMLIMFFVLTKSQYVEYDELVLIMGALTIISVVYNFNKNRENNAKIIMSSAIFSFYLCWLFSIVDIIIDHFTPPKGIEDGVPATIVFKIVEYSDDMLVNSLVCMSFVVIITFITTKTLSWIGNLRSQ